MTKLTREQIALSTIVGEGLMDETPTRSYADRADIIVRRILREPDVVLKALEAPPDALKTVGCSCCGYLLTVPDWSDETNRVCRRCGALGMPKTCDKCKDKK